MMHLRSLTLILTHWCNLSCDHCGFASGPQRPRAALPVALAREAIDEAAQRGARLIAFTGGEPFAFRELLASLVAHAGSMGLASEIATNCFWARTPAAARAALSPLARAGLRQLVVGYDAFHNRHFRRPVVLNAVHAALDEGVRSQIRVTQLRGSTSAREQVIEALALSPDAVSGDVPPARIVAEPVLAVGRAQALPEAALLRRPRDECALAGCAAAGSDPAIGPGGSVYPCCSFATVAAADGLGFNPSRRAIPGRVGEALDQIEGNLLLQLIGAIGPIRILELAGAADATDRYASPCEACLRIASDANAAREVSAWLRALVRDREPGDAT